MKEIIINSHKYGQRIVFIDDEDLESINKYTWWIYEGKNTFYAKSESRNFQKKKNVYMHRLIMNCLNNSKILIDHIDGNGLNNCKNNLRFVTNSQNLMNSKPRNKYKGITFDIKRNKWRAMIQKDSKNKSLGYFNSLIEAAKAYDRAAIYYFGEYARLNFDKSNYDIIHDKKSFIKSRDVSSTYKGVSFQKRNNKWRSYVVINYKQKYLGDFNTEEEAANSYNNFVIKNNLKRKLNIIKEN